MSAIELKDLFHEPEHQPFLWERGDSAVLMVHGYTGTPGEVRPLGWSLRQSGWTVRGVLLPGMGREIESLYERRYEDWVDSVASALQDLQSRYDPVLLVGYSMGGAIVQHAAAAFPPDGLVLMAPFSEFGSSRLLRVFWPVIRRLAPRMRPFRRADFTDPRVRRAVGRYAPDSDLSALDVQERVRRLSIPTRAFDEVWRLGAATRRLDLPPAIPTLVIQGSIDRYVRPSQTRRLLRRLPGPLQYREVAAGHTLMGPRCPVWAEVERTVVEFAQGIRDSRADAGGADPPEAITPS